VLLDSVPWSPHLPRGQAIRPQSLPWSLETAAVTDFSLEKSVLVNLILPNLGQLTSWALEFLYCPLLVPPVSATLNAPPSTVLRLGPAQVACPLSGRHQQ